MKDPYVDVIEAAIEEWRIDSIKAFEQYHKTGRKDPLVVWKLSEYSYAIERYTSKVGDTVDGVATMRRYEAEAKARIENGITGPRTRSQFLAQKGGRNNDNKKEMCV